MKKNTGKSLLIFLLVAALLGNMVQLPGNPFQVRAQEVNSEEEKAQGDEDLFGQSAVSETVSGNAGGVDIADEQSLQEAVTQYALYSADEVQEWDGNGKIMLSDEIWVEGFGQEEASCIYTGNEIRQQLFLYHGDILLKEKTDYILTYQNNINAAKYDSLNAPSVTISMRGQYSGSRTLYFTIFPRDIDEDKTQGYEQVMDYREPFELLEPAVYVDGRKLVYGRDFDCDYSTLPGYNGAIEEYIEGESYEYRVVGKGNYTGSFIMRLAVVRDKQYDFGRIVTTFDRLQYEYHGEPLSAADVGIKSVKLEGKLLDASLYEYKVDAQTVGTGYVEIYPSKEGRNAGYFGRKKLKIRVVGDRNLEAALKGGNWQDNITFSQNAVAVGGGILQQTDGVLVYDSDQGTESLIEGKDYTVQYLNHKKVGKASVTFTGLGRYRGSLTLTYTIVPNTDLSVEWQQTDQKGLPVAAYKKGGAVPRFTLSDKDSFLLSSVTDYTVILQNNQAIGTMICEIYGKGNYQGYYSRHEVQVVPEDIHTAVITASDKLYSREPEGWKAAIIVRDTDGKLLRAGIDYDRAVSYYYDGMDNDPIPKPGTVVTVTVTGIGNYTGTLTGSYGIYHTALSKLIIEIDSQEYTGKEIELSREDIHVYANTADKKAGKEVADSYKITGYANNVKTGQARVTLQGINGYGGIRTLSFQILPKGFSVSRVQKLTLDYSEIFLSAGKSKQLTASIEPIDAVNQRIIWLSSDEEVAVVSPEGVVTGKKAGKALITAVSQDTKITAACRVEVEFIPVTSIRLSESKIEGDLGEEIQLTIAEILPEDASDKTISWESSNPQVALVDESGKVLLIKEGTAIVKAIWDNPGDGTKVVGKCLVIAGDLKQKAEEGDYLTPQMFGAMENDDQDDTAAFNRAISQLGKNGTVYVPAGTYIINAEMEINLKSNMRLILDSEAIIQASGNSVGGYNIICGNNVSNVAISGGSIRGERYFHSGTSGEWGMGIGLYDSHNITVSNVKISACWGDGIYLGSRNEEAVGAGCSRIVISDCILADNRRNNLSIVCADGVVVESSSFKDAGGTAPEYGIDIETNNAANPCENIMIYNCTFTGNNMAAMGIITAANEVDIVNCRMNGDFLNYAGSSVTISDTVINGEVNARVPINLTDTAEINDGTEAEDSLIASFSRDWESCTITAYGEDSSNAMLKSIITDTGSASGRVLRLERMSTGNHDAGYCLQLSDLTKGAVSVLEEGATYRFEYRVKGSGQWGIKSTQTGWYPIVPSGDRYATGIVTYRAGKAGSCKLFLYAVDRAKGVHLEVDSIKIYKVN